MSTQRQNTTFITVLNKTFDPIPDHHAFIFSKISKLKFDYCLRFDMFYYSTFFIQKKICTNLTYRWVHFKLEHFILKHKKRRGKNFFLWLKWNFKILPTNKLGIGCPKKGRTHLVISCSEKTNSFDENNILIFHSSRIKAVFRPGDAIPTNMCKYYCRF